MQSFLILEEKLQKEIKIPGSRYMKLVYFCFNYSLTKVNIATMTKFFIFLLLSCIHFSIQAQGYVFTINKTQMMKEPSMTSKAVYVIEPKTRVQFVSKYDSIWSQVRVPGLTGYVQNSSISGFNTNLTSLKGLPYDTLSGKITLTEVVQTEGISKDELYTRAREWYAHTFKNAESVLQMDDKEAGKLIGKGFSHSSKDAFTDIWYTISVSVKDGRYKYEVSDIYYRNISSGTTFTTSIENYYSEGVVKAAHQRRYEATTESLYTLLQSLNAAMNKKASKKDDW